MTARADIACDDLAYAIASYESFGLRLEMIMPADAPRLALMSGEGLTLHLASTMAAPAVAENGEIRFQITHGHGSWTTGRAGMKYRDLIPDRLGGRVIASHIRIPHGGYVSDYVHHHRIGFQMIYCRRGWVRVVYEDQGPPFTMAAGDCVLQPPGIRHRVLESSDGLEVIEVTVPAEHETWRDHELELPTRELKPGRDFGGQRFVRHVAKGAKQQVAGALDIRDLGLTAATNGIATARVIRAVNPAELRLNPTRALLVVCLTGTFRLVADHETNALEADDACVIPAGRAYSLAADHSSEWLDVELPL